MSTEVTRILARIVKAATTAHGGGRLIQMVRERVVPGGADTMTLLGASVDHRSAAAVARFDGDVDQLTALEAEAGRFSAFRLASLHTGRWLNAGGEHSLCAHKWSAAVKYLASGLNLARLCRLADPGGSDAIASFDLAARTAVMRIDWSALVDRWPCGAVEAAGHFDHGWQTVSGRIFDDPRFDDGQFVTFYGLPAPVLKTMRGSHMIYHLGRPGSPP